MSRNRTRDVSAARPNFHAEQQQTAALPTPARPALEYIRGLFDPEDLIAFMRLRGGVAHHYFAKVSKLNEKTAEKLLQWNEAGENIYVCMNALKSRETRSKANVVAIRTAYVEIDHDGEAAKKRILESAVIPPPRFILQSSPGKYQAIWLLHDVPIEQQEQLNASLVREFGGDPASKDASRVLRLPGFKNHKYPEKPEVLVVYEGPSVRHPVDAFKLKLDHPDDGRAQKFTSPPTIHDGERNHTLFRLAASLRAKCLSDEAVRAGVHAENQEKCSPPLDTSEVDTLLDSALRKEYKKQDAERREKATTEAALPKIQAILDGEDKETKLEDLIPWLAALDILEYEGMRKRVAKHYDVRPAVLDKAVETGDAAFSKPAGETVESVVVAFNSRFFVVGSLGNKCRVCCLEPEAHPDLKGRLKLGVQTFEDFGKRFMHQKIRVGKEWVSKAWVWLDHPDRRQYDEVVFAPAQALGPSILNLWKGFAVEPKKGNCQFYLDHLRNVICAGNQKHFDYTLKWMARAVQKPGERAHVVIVVRGLKGCGKNIAFDQFGELFGSAYIPVSNAEHLFGRFNDHLRTCVMLIANETFFAGNKEHESALKTIVTEPFLTIERKFIDVTAAPNLLHLIVLSNSDWVVPASADERRFLALDASNDRIGDRNYFAALAKERDNGGREALLYHLLNEVDISGFDPRAVPKTDALRTQMAETLSGVEAAWYECLQAGEIPGEVVEKDGSARMRASSFIEWATRRNQYWRNITDERVANLLGSNKRLGERCMGFERVRVQETHVQRRLWCIPPLSECRKLWDQKRFEVEWDKETNWTAIFGVF